VSIIVTIGGGEIGRPGYEIETQAIDETIIQLSNKEKPNVLFVPTASSDSEGYQTVFKGYYGDRLGCNFNTLKLLDDSLQLKIIEEKITWADIIYVGGGNTKMMMEIWKNKGVDTLLQQARDNEKVLCGLSAGSICWFESGHSDSASFDATDDWDYIRVAGLDFIPAIHCPHYDSDTDGKPRKESFHEFMQLHKGVGIGIDECAAIIWQNDQYQVITSKDTAYCYKITEQDGVISEVIIPDTGNIADLLN
jgi:dipeptidase E